MNAVTKIDTAVAGNDIVAAVTQEPQIVLLDQEKFDQFYERMKAETDKVDADVLTPKGRDEIRSMAYRVTRSKTAIDAAAKQLTEEWRTKTAAVNEQRKVIVGRLDTLAAEVRKPLTEWEEAEKARVDGCRAIIDGFKAKSVVTLEDTADTVRARGSEVYKTELDPDVFAEMLDEAQNAKDEAVRILQAALARLTKEEADRAELERLRAENEAREAKETADREAREAAEKLAEEQRQEQQRKADAEQAEAERIANAEREAADKARIAAEELAQRKLDEERSAREAAEARAAKIQHQREWSQKIIQYCADVANGFIGGQHQAYAILHRELTEKVTATAEEFGDFAPDVEKARIEALAKLVETKRQGDERREREAREADQAHRTQVKTAAKTALITCGADEETARKIVMAILAGEVPHVRMEF